MVEREASEPVDDLAALRTDPIVSEIVDGEVEQLVGKDDDPGNPSLGCLPLLMAGSLAIGALVAVNVAHDSAEKNKNKADTEQVAPTTTPVSPESIMPNFEGITPDYFGPACSVETRTIKSGDTVFGLTTKGLEGDASFTNAVFAWNLNFIKEQAQKDKALEDPNNIPLNHKIKIQTNCTYVYPVRAVRDYENFDYSSSTEPPISHYERTLVFQNYKGTDKKTHHLTRVTYVTDKDGNAQNVDTCYPMVCYEYVVGAPEAPEYP